MLIQLAMIVGCAACTMSTSPVTTKPAVYYVPQPLYHYERHYLSPSAVRKLDELRKDLHELDDELQRPVGEIPSATAK